MAPGISAPLGEQHDDHCRLTAGGFDWWVAAVSGDHILLTNEHGRALLDARTIDWTAYAAVALQWVGERWGLTTTNKGYSA